MKKKEEKPSKLNPPIYFYFFPLWGRKTPKVWLPFFLFFLFFFGWVGKGIFYYKFLSFEKSLEIANRNQFFLARVWAHSYVQGPGYIQYLGTCRQANVNVPRDARHSDSIKKLGEKKKKTHINNWAIHPYWWIQMMMDWLMDDELIDGHWWWWWWWSVTFLFPQFCDVTKVAIICSKV